MAYTDSAGSRESPHVHDPPTESPRRFSQQRVTSDRAVEIHILYRISVFACRYCVPVVSHSVAGKNFVCKCYYEDSGKIKISPLHEIKRSGYRRRVSATASSLTNPYDMRHWRSNFVWKFHLPIQKKRMTLLLIQLAIRRDRRML